MLTFLMLVRLSTLCPSAVLQRLDRLVEPLRATCTTKVIVAGSALGYAGHRKFLISMCRLHGMCGGVYSEAESCVLGRLVFNSPTCLSLLNAEIAISPVGICHHAKKRDFCYCFVS